MRRRETVTPVPWIRHPDAGYPLDLRAAHKCNLTGLRDEMRQRPCDLFGGLGDGRSQRAMVVSARCI
jgi:hypothetical protein